MKKYIYILILVLLINIVFSTDYTNDNFNRINNDNISENYSGAIIWHERPIPVTSYANQIYTTIYDNILLIESPAATNTVAITQLPYTYRYFDDGVIKFQVYFNSSTNVNGYVAVGQEFYWNDVTTVTSWDIITRDILHNHNFCWIQFDNLTNPNNLIMRGLSGSQTYYYPNWTNNWINISIAVETESATSIKWWIDDIYVGQFYGCYYITEGVGSIGFSSIYTTSKVQLKVDNIELIYNQSMPNFTMIQYPNNITTDYILYFNSTAVDIDNDTVTFAISCNGVDITQFTNNSYQNCTYNSTGLKNIKYYVSDTWVYRQDNTTNFAEFNISIINLTDNINITFVDWISNNTFNVSQPILLNVSVTSDKNYTKNYSLIISQTTNNSNRINFKVANYTYLTDTTYENLWYYHNISLINLNLSATFEINVTVNDIYNNTQSLFNGFSVYKPSPTPPSSPGGGGGSSDTEDETQTLDVCVDINNDGYCENKYNEIAPDTYEEIPPEEIEEVTAQQIRLDPSFLFTAYNWLILEAPGYTHFDDIKTRNLRGTPVKLSFTINQNLSSPEATNWVYFEFSGKKFNQIKSVYLPKSTLFNLYRYIPTEVKIPNDAETKKYAIVYDVCDEYNYCKRLTFIINTGIDNLWNRIKYWFGKYLIDLDYVWCGDVTENWSGNCSPENLQSIKLQLRRSTFTFILISILILYPTIKDRLSKKKK